MPVASFEGQFSGASGLRVAVVVARFIDLVTGKLLSGCLDCLGRHGIGRARGYGRGAGGRQRPGRASPQRSEDQAKTGL